MPLTPTAFRPIEEAIVTAGGVDVSQINPKTMESKLASGLYFAGEVWMWTDIPAVLTCKLLFLLVCSRNILLKISSISRKSADAVFQSDF